MLRRIDRIILRVPTLASTVGYYRDILGMKLLQQDSRAAALLMSDGVTEIVLRADPDQPAEEIYYLVDSVRDLYARRDKLQLKFINPPRPTAHGYRAAVKDPFGNVLMLLDRTTARAGANATEDTATPTMLFWGSNRRFRPSDDCSRRCTKRSAAPRMICHTRRSLRNCSICMPASFPSRSQRTARFGVIS